MISNLDESALAVLPATGLLGPDRLTVARRESAERAEHEAFVQAAYRRIHGARVHSFMPTLLGLRDALGQLACVSGYRGAAEERLFLEQYLDRPVEALLAERLGHAVARGDIVEVGNLASTGCRAAIAMVALLPRHLLTVGHRWIVFTATGTVHRILESLGVPMLELAAADAARVAAGPDEWGSYYRNDPRVFAARVADGLHLRPPGRPRTSSAGRA